MCSAPVDSRPLSDPVELFSPAAEVERFMSDWVGKRPMPEHLREAVLYALMAPGKRLRPILVIRSAEAIGDAAAAMPAAAAIEMIHNFSLVHDDLPALDDDDLRRGRPTLHVHTNEPMAILAGDLLMGLAFELLAEQQPGGLAASLTAELARATNDMIVGQVHDTLPAFEPETPPIERLKTIHRNKTGALIRGACRMGGLSAGADRPRLEALTRYGQAIGLMFQIVDDVLDVTKSTKEMGKRTGKDAEAGKLTYPGVLGLEQSRSHVRELTGQAHAALDPLGRAADPLRALCDFLAARQK